MCVGPIPGTSDTTPQIKPKVRGIADAPVEVWQRMAEQGGTMGEYAKTKLAALTQNGPSKVNDLQYPTITPSR